MKADSLAQKVYMDIHRKILSGQLQPKTRLKEDAWAKKLEVSRVAVREALNRLYGEGLLTLGEKGGYFVRVMTPEDVHEIREIREILELGALKLARKKISKEQIATLVKICDDFTAMVKSGYFGGALEADMKFHETLIECSGNRKLMAAYRSSHIPLFQQKMRITDQYMADCEETDREHRQILKGIISKNFDLAERTLVKHFARGESTVLDFD